MPLRIIDGQYTKVQFQFEPCDLWIGAFWRILQLRPPFRTFHLYVCLIPMVPLHVTHLFLSRSVSRFVQKEKTHA